MRICYQQSARDDVIRQFRYYLVEQNLPELALRFRESVKRTAVQVQVGEQGRNHSALRRSLLPPADSRRPARFPRRFHHRCFQPLPDQRQDAPVRDPHPQAGLQLVVATRFRSARSSLRPRPVRPYWLAPAPKRLPACPADKSGHTARRTGTSAPAWLFGPASVSVERVSPAGSIPAPFPAAVSRTRRSPVVGFSSKRLSPPLTPHVSAPAPSLHGRYPLHRSYGPVRLPDGAASGL